MINQKVQQYNAAVYLRLSKEDMDSAQKCFDELDKDTQKSFLTYPICHFGKPTLSKDTANL